MAVSVETRQNLIALLVAFALCFAAAAVGELLTRPNLAWYASLEPPGFTPPNGVFPLVWTVLYAIMAISAWLFWRAKGREQDRRLGLVWFAIQLALNVAWSFAFFWLRNPGAGLLVVLLLLVAIAVTIVLFDRSSRAAALLLVPYLLWICFATALNFAFWFLNR
jgi:tryptophan-rich sensory protein